MSLPDTDEAGPGEASGVHPADREIAEAAPLVIEHLNEDHPDSLEFLARVLGPRPQVASARIVSVDRLGFAMDVDSGSGPEVVRIGFLSEATGAADLSDQATALLTLARARSGEAGLTSMERDRAELAQVRTFVTEVVAAEQVNPHFRQLTIGGRGLEGLVVDGPDTFLYVLAPRPPSTELSVDETFTWEGLRAMPAEQWPVGGYYTVRRWDPDRHEVDLLFVLHEGGEAAGWAAQAGPGDAVALWGPRTGFEPPPGTRRYLLVADETGLPATASILDSLPAGTPVQAVIEVPDDSARLDLATSPAVDVTWLHRDGAPAGTTTLLVDAVRGLDLDTEGLYAWGGGESREVTAVRRHLRQGRGMPQSQVLMTGYWRATTH